MRFRPYSILMMLGFAGAYSPSKWVRGTRKEFMGHVKLIAGAAFVPFSAVASQPMNGIYSDPNHPNGFRRLRSDDGKTVTVEGSDDGPIVKWTLPGKVQGDSVLIDFSKGSILQ